MLSAAATGLGGSNSTGLGYNVGATYTLPAFFERNQSLSFNVGALKQDFTAYRQTALLAGTTLTRKFDTHWSVNVGLSGTIEQDEQEGITRDYDLIQVPLGLKYDSTNSLFDATRGIRAQATVTPTESLLSPSATFTILQLSGSTYIDLTGRGRSVIALRALVGTVQGASTFELPPDQRFYAGGSATIRGYDYQSVGPQFPDGTPRGRNRDRCGHNRVSPALRWKPRHRPVRRCGPGQCVAITLPRLAQGRRGPRASLLHADRADPGGFRGAAGEGTE